jgi:hypothetical protein
MSPAASVVCFAVAWHLFLPGKTHVFVNVAIEGAARRLATPECQRVFDDFQDGQGQPLSAVLAARNMTHVEFLSSLYFVDGDGTQPCRAPAAPVAFTTPGRRVIHVCSAPFASAFDSSQRYAQIVVIHEMLHSLGLGENPPTSAAITAQVMRRCGGQAQGS